MYYPNIWSAMSTIGVADHNIPAQIGSEQQLAGAQGTIFHGFPWFLHVFPKYCIFMGFHGFYGFSWFFMVFHGFSWEIAVYAYTKTNRFHIANQTAPIYQKKL